MIDFRRPFREFREEVVNELPLNVLPPSEFILIRIETLLWVLIRLVYELGRALIQFSNWRV